MVLTEIFAMQQYNGDDGMAVISMMILNILQKHEFIDVENIKIDMTLNNSMTQNVL